MRTRVTNKLSVIDNTLYGRPCNFRYGLIKLSCILYTMLTVPFVLFYMFIFLNYTKNDDDDDNNSSSSSSNNNNNK